MSVSRIARSVSSQLRRLYFQCLSLEHTKDPVLEAIALLEAIRELWVRYQIWIEGLEKMRSKCGSLDQRLMRAPLQKGTLESFLRSLGAVLYDIQDVITQQRPSIEDMPEADRTYKYLLLSDASRDDQAITKYFEMKENIKECEEIVTRLSRLSETLPQVGRTSMIARPSTRSEAHRFRPKDLETGVDLLDKYYDLDYQHIATLFANAPHHLVAKLTRCNSRRRQVLLYWRHCAEGQKDSARVTTNDIDFLHDPAEGDVNLRSSSTADPLLSDPQQGTLATNEQLVDLPQRVDRPTTSTEATIESTAKESKVEGVYDISMSPCALCSADVSRFCSTKGQQRTHVCHDLRPYICTYQECEDTQRMWSSRKEWWDHELTHHRQIWNCLEHSVSFAGKHALEDHYLRHHSLYTADELEDMIFKSEVRARVTVHRCPLCRSEEQDLPRFKNHVGDHLLKIALSVSDTISTSDMVAFQELATASDEDLESVSSSDAASESGFEDEAPLDPTNTLPTTPKVLLSSRRFQVPTNQDSFKIKRGGPGVEITQSAGKDPLTNMGTGWDRKLLAPAHQGESGQDIKWGAKDPGDAAIPTDAPRQDIKGAAIESSDAATPGPRRRLRASPFDTRLFRRQPRQSISSAARYPSSLSRLQDAPGRNMQGVVEDPSDETTSANASPERPEASGQFRHR